uniref:CYTH domain-containing protein n=1 Tax=Fagus sylvatica TaxID=28930 RepID=A0A2N9G525_FAGSY
MEVEVKLRLPDAIAHRHVTTVLTPFHVTTHRQENNFFNGSSNELSSRRAILRLRFADTNPRCVVTLKAKVVIVDGVSRVEEDEEVLDTAIGRECLAEPANPRPTTTPRSENPSLRDMENGGERGEQRRKMKRRERKKKKKKGSQKYFLIQVKSS